MAVALKYHSLFPTRAQFFAERGIFWGRNPTTPHVGAPKKNNRRGKNT
jgi:hypothetical protein